MSAKRVSAQGGAICPGGVCLGGVCLGWGCLPMGGVHPPAVDRILDTRS